MSAIDEVRKIFCTLDHWRHLPAYQLERRADIFFAMYLPYVLEKHRSVEIEEWLVPEFPIKKKINNQSHKADYLAISKDRKYAFLIELKTDMRSLRKEQTEAYEQAKDIGLSQLVKGIIGIRGGPTKQRKKYDNLLELLAKLDLVHEPDDTDTYKNAVENPEPNIEILYIQPELEKPKPSRPDCQPTIITFCQFADAIEDRGEVAKLFAGYLRRWASIKAGDPHGEPGKLSASAS